MNARQRAKFEARYGVEPYSQDGTANVRGKLAGWNALRTTYSAACQDEAEAVRGLVEALEDIAKDDYMAGMVASAALKAWKGE